MTKTKVFVESFKMKKQPTLRRRPTAAFRSTFPWVIFLVQADSELLCGRYATHRQ